MKTHNPDLTKVIFRRWPNGSVIALFPQIPHDANGTYCMSYEHVGQHGAAATDLPNTTLATPEQYADLKAELERIGYALRVAKKVTRKDYEIRRKAAAAA